MYLIRYPLDWNNRLLTVLWRHVVIPVLNPLISKRARCKQWVIICLCYIEQDEQAQLQLEFKCWLINSVTGDKVPVCVAYLPTYIYLPIYLPLTCLLTLLPNYIICETASANHVALLLSHRRHYKLTIQTWYVQSVQTVINDFYLIHITKSWIYLWVYNRLNWSYPLMWSL